MSVEEKLIELVREQPIIYNTTEGNYSNVIKKSKVWDTIALQCNLNTGEEAKKLWIKLRDAYRSSLKRSQTRSGDGGSYIKPWKFQEHMRDRKRFTNEDVSQIDDIDIDIDMGETGESPKCHDNCDGSGNERPPPKKKMDVPSLLVELRKDHEERRRNREEFRRQILQPPNELKLFFDSMYESTKKLQPSLQRVVKRRLFAIVAEAEDIEERPNGPPQYCNSPGPAHSPQERSCPSQSSSSSGGHLFPYEYHEHFLVN